MYEVGRQTESLVAPVNQTYGIVSIGGEIAKYGIRFLVVRCHIFTGVLPSGVSRLLNEQVDFLHQASVGITPMVITHFDLTVT